MSKPNRDLDQAGHTARIKPDHTLATAGNALANYLATDIAKVRAHLQQELNVCDGHPERGDQVAVASSGITSTTESAMLARERLTEALDKINDTALEAVDAINRLRWAIKRGERLVAPKDVVQPSTVKLCMDGLTDSTRPGSIEWHDATCRNAPTTRGLCKQHYDAMRYWRRNNGLSELPESPLPDVPGLVRSTAEVLVRDGELGAAHAYPAKTVHIDA